MATRFRRCPTLTVWRGHELHSGLLPDSIVRAGSGIVPLWDLGPLNTSALPTSIARCRGRYATAEAELYDLESDPSDLRSRAANASCGGILRRLRQRLVAWTEANNGRLFYCTWIRLQILEGRKR